MPAADDEIQTLASRPGWTVDLERELALYLPNEVGWSAKLRRVRGGTGKGYDRYDRWHVAVVDPMGVCRQAKPFTYLSDALRFAEGRVNAEN